MKAPDVIETARLVLRRPRPDDAEAIFSTYASDPEVTRFVGFPRHQSVDDARAFLRVSEQEWERRPAGAYLIELGDGRLIGGTGLHYANEYRAHTGYVLAKDSWGLGYATEALGAMVDLARALGLHRIEALCCPEHAASWRVLEKCGFQREGILARYLELPNLSPGRPSDVLLYALVLR